MCGITGFVDFSGRSGPETLKRMADAIVHRGPDDEGLECFKRSCCFGAVLGFRRLRHHRSGARQATSRCAIRLTVRGSPSTARFAYFRRSGRSWKPPVIRSIPFRYGSHPARHSGTGTSRGRSFHRDISPLHGIARPHAN